MKITANLAPIATAFALSACSSTGSLPQNSVPAADLMTPISSNSSNAVQCLKRAVDRITDSNSMMSIFEEGASTLYLIEASNAGSEIIATVAISGLQTETKAEFKGRNASAMAAGLQNSANECGLYLS